MTKKRYIYRKPFVSLPGEEWRSVVGFTGYEVSNLGRVRSYRICGRAKRLADVPVLRKTVKTKRGYMAVMLCIDNQLSLYQVSHLVLEAFVGPAPEGTEARHVKDPNTENNNLYNLAWGTRKENYADKIVHGTDQRGERNHQCKLTDDQVHEIRASSERLKVLAVKYGVRESQISRIRNGVRRAG